jgi:hypothetical protein
VAEYAPEQPAPVPYQPHAGGGVCPEAPEDRLPVGRMTQDLPVKAGHSGLQLSSRPGLRLQAGSRQQLDPVGKVPTGCGAGERGSGSGEGPVTCWEREETVK